MKIGAYQFAVTGNIKQNMSVIEKAISQAAQEGVEMLIFPECALTGYPPHDMKNSAGVNFAELDAVYEHLQTLADNLKIHIAAGTIMREKDKYYNSGVVFSPDKPKDIYFKRALWGWDKENFCAGNRNGIFEINGIRIGIRICFEVRFPEYFRELYMEKTELNLILFYDVSDHDDVERYELIKSHIRTRAVENVCDILTVDAIRPFQTAPTAFFDKSGHVEYELERNTEGMLVFDFEKKSLNFGEKGRKEISDTLTARI
ncbi:MAG: carbon-nitrogen hydrolase family protein [Lachnospiraceae bacterium]|nr:carbon-nitrogen hydrolase family protein [Lachnospiraceae bacterium]